MYIILFTPLRFLLRLNSNKIGDKGAMSIGEALKNCGNLKTLRYVVKELLTVVHPCRTAWQPVSNVTKCC